MQPESAMTSEPSKRRGRFASMTEKGRINADGVEVLRS